MSASDRSSVLQVASRRAKLVSDFAQSWCSSGIRTRIRRSSASVVVVELLGWIVGGWGWLIPDLAAAAQFVGPSRSLGLVPVWSVWGGWSV